jgi:hypothetical protein
MSGPQTAQTRATLAASPSNSLESPCQKARSRLPAVLRFAILTMCEVSTCSARRARSSTGAVAWHTRFRRAPHKKRRTRRLSAPSTRNHGAVRGGPRQSRDFIRRDRRRDACGPHPPPCPGGTPRLPRRFVPILKRGRARFYVGHGGPDIWADEVVLSSDDFADLPLDVNRGSVFFAWSCRSNMYQYYYGPSIREAALRNAGGAVAAIGGANMSQADEQAQFADRVYAEIARGRPLGEAMRRGQDLGAQAEPRDHGSDREQFQPLWRPLARAAPVGRLARHWSSPSAIWCADSPTTCGVTQTTGSESLRG